MGNVMQLSDRIGCRMKLHDLHVLMAVVQTGSMSKAANLLNTGQPAISRSIAELEHALGVRLLDRSRRGVAPTLYGDALIRRGIAVFDELTQGVKDIAALADPTAGELRVAASIAIAAGLLTAVIDRLTRRHPRLIVHVLAAETATVCHALENRTVDLAIVHMIEPLALGDLDAQILFDEPQVVATSSENPVARRRRMTLADLMDEPWALPPLDSRFGMVAREAFRAGGLELPRKLVTSGLPVRNALLATGRFITMVPRVVIAFQAKPAALVQLPIDLPITRRPVGVITVKNRTLSSAANLFIESAREIAKPLTRK
jgi:DNA-binding transcriptional LysR family regulator